MFKSMRMIISFMWPLKMHHSLDPRINQKKKSISTYVVSVKTSVFGPDRKAEEYECSECTKVQCFPSLNHWACEKLYSC